MAYRQGPRDCPERDDAAPAPTETASKSIGLLNRPENNSPLGLEIQRQRVIAALTEVGIAGIEIKDFVDPPVEGSCLRSARRCISFDGAEPVPLGDAAIAEIVTRLRATGIRLVNPNAIPQSVRGLPARLIERRA